MQAFKIGEINIELIKKQIKNLHLRVYPMAGKVQVSAPLKMELDVIANFVNSKLNWIKRKQEFFKSYQFNKIELPDRNVKMYLGESYKLIVIEREAPAQIILAEGEMRLYVRKGVTKIKRAELIEQWYRRQLKLLIEPMIPKWEQAMSVRVREFRIKKMKTRWGTCNPTAQRIWLSLELVKKPVECLEYVVVHEMVHLLERGHGHRFKSFMDQFLPNWRDVKRILNQP